MGRHYLRVANGMKVAVVLFVGGLGLITFINFAGAAPIAPWWFYVLALASAGIFWKIATLFEQETEGSQS